MQAQDERLDAPAALRCSSEFRVVKRNERVLDGIMIRHADLQSDSQSAHFSQLESLKDNAGCFYLIRNEEEIRCLILENLQNNFSQIT